MSGLNYCSDYGSLTSSNSSSTWSTSDSWPHQTNLRHSRSNEKTSASYQDLVMGKCTLEDIMKEFQMNGSDSPYSPDEDSIWGNPAISVCGVGGGGSGAYLRQKSWPAPDSSPAPRLPRRDFSCPLDFTPTEFTSTSTPVEESSNSHPTLSDEQLRVLGTLPNFALFALLQQLEQTRDGHKRVKRLPSECRFCKNNGERECYYRSHLLKDGAGRVTCPVLRAFVCARCGASGDTAHTIKYCPLSTTDERIKSAAMLRSVRLASGRRRAAGSVGPPAPSSPGQYFVFGEPTPNDVIENNSYNSYALSSPLDPLWAALEQKLLS